MEPLQKHKHTVKAMEVLYVESAMLEKTKGGMTSFSTMGPLSVLYFKRFDRFVLRLNDWMYPLIRRLPIMTAEKELHEVSYMMPAMNGFIYKLKIMGDVNPNIICNLETILSRNSRFANKGEEIPSRKMEMMSPDDKVVRQMTLENEPTEILMGMMMDTPAMEAAHRMRMAEERLRNMTRRMMSRKKRMNLKKIENKNWRKEAKSRIRSYFETTGKVTQEFMNLRRNNSNLTQAKEYDELKNFSDSKLPVLYIKRDEIEQAILTNKELASQGDDLSKMMAEQNRDILAKENEEKGGILSYLWSGLSGITNYIFGRGTNTSPSPASKGPMEAHENVTTVSENKQGQTLESEAPISEAVKTMAEECHLKDVMMKDQMTSKPMSGSQMSMDMQRKPMEKNSKDMINQGMSGKMIEGIESQIPSRPMGKSEMSMDMQRKPMKKNSEEMMSQEMRGNKENHMPSRPMGKSEMGMDMQRKPIEKSSKEMSRKMVGGMEN